MGGAHIQIVAWGGAMLLPASVVSIIWGMKLVAPVRVSCVCGASAWVGPKASVRFLHEFVHDHAEHNEMMVVSLLPNSL